MDPRRAVPRTDTVLADPRLADVTARLGRDQVKAAVAAAQQAVREGALADTQKLVSNARPIRARATRTLRT